MTELLAPAGNYESLVAAISNGCDAIYLGLDVFGARAYAENFTLDTLSAAIKYAHLRNVKIYITMNTIIFDHELELAYQTADAIAALGADGIIIQDIALINYIKNKFTRIEAHASTQCGIDSLDAVLYFKDLNTDRCVLAREMTSTEILDIKAKTKMELEVFVHGALCVSYSGNCLMSGLIGYRSGNRGRCVGSCRKPFALYDEDGTFYTKDSYILSMKDLNTLSNINDLENIDSLKIEGRMKEPIYVANIVNHYRKAIDKNNFDLKQANYELSKTFNRTFTKGYLLKDDRKNVTNLERPNHNGYEIGVVVSKKKNRYGIKLTDTLNQNDQVRIREISIPVVKMYNDKDLLINGSDSFCYLDFKEPAYVGDKVYKTRDVDFNKQLTKSFPKEYRRCNITMYVNLTVDKPIELTILCDDITITCLSDELYQAAINKPVLKENIEKQLSKLTDTVYALEHIEVTMEDGFIPIKVLNELRRKAIEMLDAKRLEFSETTKAETTLSVPSHQITNPIITVFANTLAQKQAALDLGITNVYYDNVARRNKTNYPTCDTVLVGGYNGLYHYKNKAEIITDFSLNVCNYQSVALLHSYGANRVTLSHEMNKKQINSLSENYFAKYQTYPNLELIVYGRADLMFTNYCPLKPFNLCGKCKDKQYYLSDEFGEFPIISHNDCTTTILNGKVLNLIDNVDEMNNINAYRLQFTIESYEETKKVINNLINKLNGSAETFFDSTTDTRGHFNREIL